MIKDGTTGIWMGEEVEIENARMDDPDFYIVTLTRTNMPIGRFRENEIRRNLKLNE